MDGDKERAEFYLSRWRELMASENPLRHITWYAGGAVENESMVVSHLRTLQDSLRRAVPEVTHKIFTNCRDIEGWQDSYVFSMDEVPGDSGHTYQKGVHASVAGYLEDGLTADLYMTNGFPPAFALYALGLGYFNDPIPPVISVMAKTPEALWDYVTEPFAIHILRMMADVQSFWIFVLDSANEEGLMRKLLELAELLVDQRNEDLICFAVQGKLVAMVHSEASPQAIRGNISIFKGLLKRVVEEWESQMQSK